LTHRGRTIDEDLADSVGSTIGFARARYEDAQAGGTDVAERRHGWIAAVA
jgi:hypothetical protein